MAPRFIVLTYNRPRSLRRLLVDLREEGALDVVVYDDGSTADYSSVRRFITAQGWQFVVVPHHGKRDFWRLVDHVYRAQSQCSADWFVFLPDDVRLCCRFWERVCEAWNSINDPKKTALNLLRDSGREGRACWTGQTPHVASHYALRTGWIDGLFAAPRAYLETLGFQGIPVPDAWFDVDRSSGTYNVISHKLHAQGLGLYQVTRSLVVHSGSKSVMQPEIRMQEPLHALHYIDGEKAEARLADPSDEVTVGIATLPDRTHLLERVVDTLYDQVDRLCVYLNGHDEVPAFLNRDKIVYERGDNHLGDAAKFWWAATAAGYYFACDDDILYPSNYVERLVDGIETYQRRAVVGVLGRTLRQPVKAYYANRLARYGVRERLDRDTLVHIVGTGTSAHFAPTLRVTMADFPERNMADIWFSLAAHRGAVPRIVVCRQAGWLSVLTPPEGTTIYEQFAATKDDQIQTQAIQRGEPWPATGPADRGLVLLEGVSISTLMPPAVPPQPPRPAVPLRTQRRPAPLPSASASPLLGSAPSRHRDIPAELLRVLRTRRRSAVTTAASTPTQPPALLTSHKLHQLVAAIHRPLAVSPAMSIRPMSVPLMPVQSTLVPSMFIWSLPATTLRSEPTNESAPPTAPSCAPPPTAPIQAWPTLTPPIQRNRSPTIHAWPRLPTTTRSKK